MARMRGAAVKHPDEGRIAFVQADAGTFQAASQEAGGLPERRSRQSLPGGNSLLIEDFGGGHSRCRVSRADGSLLAQWHCADNRGAFYTAIAHRNGGTYLLFREDLYGYSVLDLASGARFRYWPLAVAEGGEDFIWTDVHYNPQAGLLAVGGCFWACPYDLLLLKWDEPMRLPAYGVLLSRQLDGYFDDYDGDVDFHGWDGGDLLYTAKRLHAEHAAPERIPQPRLSAWLY